MVMLKTLLEEGGLVDDYAKGIIIDLCRQHQRRRKKTHLQPSLGYQGHVSDSEEYRRQSVCYCDSKMGRAKENRKDKEGANCS